MGNPNSGYGGGKSQNRYASKTTRGYAKCIVSNNNLRRKNKRQGIKGKGNAIKTGGNIIPVEKKKKNN